jgi:subtilisin family serine protease
LGHGTAVAGVLGASSDNAQGVAGVTWQNPIMPLVVVNADSRAAYSDIVAAIRYAADHGVRVANISLGGTAPSEALQEAVDYAWSKGTLVFAAAMNQSATTPFYPGACRRVVAVSAINVIGGLAPFSNYGEWVSLAAPGALIMSTSRGGGYGYQSGTSFASPVAAGVAALVVSMNPALGPGQVLEVLRKSADDIGAPGYDIHYGWGRVNAAKALAAARATLSAPDPEPAPDPGHAQP